MTDYVSELVEDTAANFGREFMNEISRLWWTAYLKEEEMKLRIRPYPKGGLGIGWFNCVTGEEMKMKTIEVDQETMDAHKASEAMWQERVKEEGWDAEKKCAHCTLGQKRRDARKQDFAYEGCPIHKDTGQKTCEGTPYWKAKENPTAENKGRMLDYLRGLGKRLVLKKDYVLLEDMPEGVPYRYYHDVCDSPDEEVMIRISLTFQSLEKAFQNFTHGRGYPILVLGRIRTRVGWDKKNCKVVPLTKEEAEAVRLPWKAVL